jgi:hypothetical protein
MRRKKLLKKAFAFKQNVMITVALLFLLLYGLVLTISYPLTHSIWVTINWGALFASLGGIIFLFRLIGFYTGLRQSEIHKWILKGGRFLCLIH